MEDWSLLAIYPGHSSVLRSTSEWDCETQCNRCRREERELMSGEATLAGVNIGTLIQESRSAVKVLCTTFTLQHELRLEIIVKNICNGVCSSRCDFILLGIIIISMVLLFTYSVMEKKRLFCAFVSPKYGRL